MVTFIIVTWNNEELINKLFETLKKFCDVKYNVIVVDNDSKDNTKIELEKIKDENIKIIYSDKNLGFAKANNLALNMVETEYVCFLNPDVVFIENIIEKMIQILIDNDNIAIVGPKLLNADKTFQKSSFRFDNEKNIICNQLNFKEKIFKKMKNSKSGFVDWIMGAMMLMRTSEAKKVQAFSEEYFMYVEDMDLCMKVYKKLNKLTYYISDVKLIHLGGQSELKNNNYKKDEIVIENIIKFNDKFYNNGKKIIKKLQFCYLIKMLYSKCVYRLRKNEKNKLILNKMENSYRYLKNKRDL